MQTNLPETAALRDEGRRRGRKILRQFLDTIAQYIVSLGGIGVMVTLLLLFVFLVYEVIPLFRPASIEFDSEFSLPVRPAVQTLHLAMEEQGEVGFRLASDGIASIIDLHTGRVISNESLPVPAGDEITGFAVAGAAGGPMVLGLKSGRALVVGHQYRIEFPDTDNTRTITPFLGYPLGRSALDLGADAALTSLALARKDDSIVLAARDETNRVHVLRAVRERNLFTPFHPVEDPEYEMENVTLTAVPNDVFKIMIGGDLRRLLLLPESGRLRVFDINQMFGGPAVAADFDLGRTPARPVAAELLLGGLSLLVAESSGLVNQYFFIDSAAGNQLLRVRSFAGSGQPLAFLLAEPRSKGFIGIDQQGFLQAFNTTASRETYSKPVAGQAPVAATVSPRGSSLLLETEPGRFSVWQIDNPHPEVSWDALWSKVWYEGYAEPDYIWQTSATASSLEPKYSLVPLAFGTLKAALCAMLLAAPLAIGAAIYTGHFMAPAMRRKAKPVIELMEAIPAVVLGLLAGLWLAPLVEKNLLGVFCVLVILPLGMMLAGLLWTLLPRRIRHGVPDGWEAALLLPVVLSIGWLSFAVAAPLESVFFAGDLPGWINTALGINYVQRNALVVGFAMGFAVIPTIFSIAEDAIFTVPRHLSSGSMALGATAWQSLYHVILPTASPGIFSALMIGLGRAVGETMIVLMATGNTPIMDINLFDGMRTLAASIAVEIPESAVGSTHYRILFLAAMVLFLFTFAVNTLAELVRYRLRCRYGNL